MYKWYRIFIRLWEKQRLSDMLKAFYSCVELPIQVIDDTGQILDAQGQTASLLQPV